MVERKYTYSPPIIRKAIWELMWLSRGVMLPGLILLMLIVYLIASDKPPFVWLSGFIAGFAITYFALVLRSYLYATQRIKKYEGVEIQLGFYERSIAVNSLIMSSSFPWTSVTRLQTTRNFLFLTLVGSAQPILVPLNIFSADDIQFIKNQYATNKIPR